VLTLPIQRQWLGIIIVAIGLAFSAIEEIFAPVHAAHVLFGCAMSLLSALLLSFDDVVAEAAMSAPHAPSSQQVTARMGSLATMLCGSYVVRCLTCC
jgi:hypothetical protein